MTNEVIRTNIDFIDNMTINNGIQVGSTIVVIYEAVDHGTKLLENLATVGYPSRFITSSRTAKLTRRSMERIVPGEKIDKNTKIRACDLDEYPEAIIEETKNMTDENIVIEEFGRILGVTEHELQAVELIKQIREKIVSQEKLLFLGIKRSNIDDFESLQTITATADGVIEMRKDERGEETKNLVTLRRLPGEREMPKTTGVPIGDKIEKAGTQELR